MIWQFAQMVKKKYQSNGVDAALFGDIQVSLNGRSYQPFIRLDVDLITLPRPGNGVD